MDQDEIKSKVNELMHRSFEIPVEKLTPESKLMDELGLDSLDAVDMMVHLEDHLGVKVSSDKLSKIKTLQDVYELVAEAKRSESAIIG
jgi:acyl carrier protein